MQKFTVYVQLYILYYSKSNYILSILPWSALADEDQGTHNNTGQCDAHTNNDPCHRPLVYMVETIRESCKTNIVLFVLFNIE